MFELREVSFGYPGKDKIFSNLTFHFYREFTLVQGPSGSGKSTLLRLLNRLLVPQAGEILYRGQPLDSYEATLLRRRIVYLQQLPVMLEATVRENLLLPFKLQAAGKNPLPGDDELRANLQAFLLGQVSLEEDAQKLSVGQKQRLALIRALLLKPEVLLLDEPTASLDRESREIVEDRAENLNLVEGVGVIMISHSAYIPRKLKPRLLILEGGCLREVRS